MNERPWLRPSPVSEFCVQSVAALQGTNSCAPWLQKQAADLLERPDGDHTSVRALLRACAYQRFAVTPHTIEFHETPPPPSHEDVCTYGYLQPVDNERWDVRTRVEGVLLGTGEDARYSEGVPDECEQASGEVGNGISSDIIRVDAFMLSAAYHQPRSVERVLLEDITERLRKKLLRYAYVIERERGEWHPLERLGFRTLSFHHASDGGRFLVLDHDQCPWLT